MEMRLTFDVDDRIHMDYLAYLFERDTSGAYIVTARNCFGKLIIGHTQAASLPPKEACGKFAVTFILPINEATQNFQNKFIYLSAQATKQLNISLRAYFELDFWEFVQRRKALRQRKEEIIEAFILSRKLFSAEYFESLHKRAYRRELKELEALKRKLTRRTYYIESLVDEPKKV